MVDTKGRMPVSIETLVHWAYGKCYVHRMDRGTVGLNALEAGPDGLTIWKSSGDGVIQCLRQAELGTKIAGGGLVPIPDAPADAQAVHAHVLRLDGPVQRLVIVNGGLGSWPVSRVNDPALRAIPGRSRAVARDQRSWCEVVFADDTREIEAARRNYRLWWLALSGLAALFRSRPNLLVRHRVTHQAAPAWPWKRRETGQRERAA